MDERTAYLAFNLTPGVGPQRLRALIEHCGSAAAAWHATTDDWRAAGLDRRTAEALRQARATLDLAAEWRAIEAIGARVICRDDAEYPVLLRQLDAPPPLLYVRGTLVETDRWAVAVVGTRNATPYGREVAYKLASELAGAGITVVSGLALGIDAIAHKAAIERGGRTLAVLGSGLHTIYPPQHRALAEHICEQGALICEYAPTAAPLSGNFPARNRLISGLALGTLVVEAGARSGALITAQFALEQGRDVFAVPGSILSPASDGPNQLIVDGATPVRGVAAILDSLNIAAGRKPADGYRELAGTPMGDTAVWAATQDETAILRVLSHDPTHIDALGRASGLAAADLAAALGMLEIKGVVRCTGNSHYALARDKSMA